MKASTLFLSLSLAGNLALGAAVLFWLAPRAHTSAVAASTSAVESRTPAVPSPSATALQIHPVGTGMWDQLQGKDLVKVVARLRAAGFPPSMLRAVVGPLLGERFAARRRALESVGEKPFWKSRSDPVDPRVQTELNALNREQSELYRKLLGRDIDGADGGGRVAMLQKFGREFTPEKRERIEAIRRSFFERLSEVQTASDPDSPLPEDSQKYNRAMREQRDELAKILSPEELLEYDLRNSTSSRQLRYDLAAFHPTEAEFRALFPVQQALDQQFPPQVGYSPTEMASRAAAVAQTQEQIKALLGPERYAEYQLTRNGDYQQIAKLTDRLSLPATTTAQVYAVQQDIQRRLSAIRTVSPEERAAQNAALANEATQKISALIGANGFEAYQQYGGQWLQRLQNPARPRTNPNKP